MKCEVLHLCIHSSGGKNLSTCANCWLRTVNIVFVISLHSSCRSILHMVKHTLFYSMSDD